MIVTEEESLRKRLAEATRSPVDRQQTRVSVLYCVLKHGIRGVCLRNHDLRVGRLPAIVLHDGRPLRRPLGLVQNARDAALECGVKGKLVVRTVRNGHVTMLKIGKIGKR